MFFNRKYPGCCSQFLFSQKTFVFWLWLRVRALGVFLDCNVNGTFPACFISSYSETQEHKINFLLFVNDDKLRVCSLFSIYPIWVASAAIKAKRLLLAEIRTLVVFIPTVSIPSVCALSLVEFGVENVSQLFYIIYSFVRGFDFF